MFYMKMPSRLCHPCIQLMAVGIDEGVLDFIHTPEGFVVELPEVEPGHRALSSPQSNVGSLRCSDR